jgi:hypothetical protein
MLQALEYGIPILAPNKGVIGYRIEKYNLGITYPDPDMASLKSQYQFFKDTDPKSFENDIKSYMNFQNVEQLKNVLVNSFITTKTPVIVP